MESPLLNPSRARPARVLNNLAQKKAHGGSTEDRKMPAKKPKRKSEKTFICRMLSPMSHSHQAVIYRLFVTLVIAANIIALIIESYDELHAVIIFHSFTVEDLLDTVERVTAWLFLVDYILRLVTITEHRRYAELGCLRGRVHYALTFSGLIDAFATFPYFLDAYLFENVLPSTTWLRALRLMRIFRTNAYVQTASTVVRVLVVNKEILVTSMFMVFFMLLLTSALLYLVAGEDERKANDINSIPDAMYISVMMLTGQGDPEGDLSFRMQLVCVITAFLSVPFFAVPAAMLTWGFEGEADRLAKKAQQNYRRRIVYQSHKSTSKYFESSDSSSSDAADDGAFEEYLNQFGAGDDDKEHYEEQALAYFKEAKEDESLLDQLLPFAHELERKRKLEAEERTLREDALVLMQSLAMHDKDDPDFWDDDWRLAAEERLQWFHKQIRTFESRSSKAFEERSTSDKKPKVFEEHLFSRST